jgi:hypothetical protein
LDAVAVQLRADLDWVGGRPRSRSNAATGSAPAGRLDRICGDRLRRSQPLPTMRRSGSPVESTRASRWGPSLGRQGGARRFTGRGRYRVGIGTARATLCGPSRTVDRDAARVIAPRRSGATTTRCAIACCQPIGSASSTRSVAARGDVDEGRLTTFGERSRPGSMCHDRYTGSASIATSLEHPDRRSQPGKRRARRGADVVAARPRSRAERLARFGHDASGASGPSPCHVLPRRRSRSPRRRGCRCTGIGTPARPSSNPFVGAVCPSATRCSRCVEDAAPSAAVLYAGPPMAVRDP